MDISVIIPTYKPQEYFFTCLESLCNQTLLKNRYELIIVLNGCKEPYERLILDYLNNSGLNYQFFQVDIGNVSNARNIGLDAAKGDYIAFIDDDDFVSPKYLEELYNLSSKKTIALSYELAFNDGTDIYYPYYITNDYDKYHQQGIIPFYKPRRLFCGPVYKIIHRDIIGSRRFEKKFKNAEDSLFMILLSDKFVNVVFTSKDAVYYRRVRQNSASTTKKNFVYRLKNGIMLIGESLKIYFSNRKAYNFRFVGRQILGFIRDICLQ